MAMYNVKPIKASVLIGTLLLMAGASYADPQTASKKPAAKPMASRSAQRATFTPEDKESFEKETRTAIIVAPSYLDSGLAPLKFTFADAVELKAELERQGYTARIIPSTEATADGIRQTLTTQKELLDGSSQATLLFAFMGHGFQDSKGKNFLMTYGATLENMDKEALSLEDVEERMNSTSARRKVIFIDACRKVNGTRDADKPRTMSDFKAAEGMAILLATRPGNFSYEDPELSHGVFTYYLLDGLRGKAAGKDGYVSFHDLSTYVERSVLAYSMKKDQPQKPLATMQDVGGDFLMATAEPPKPDEIKPVVGASQITSDAVVMQGLEIKRSFFAMLSQGSLTLTDASNGQPFAMLSEHPEQLKDTSLTASRGLRWFAGIGPDNTAVQMVAEMHGNSLFALWGRMGKPCPNDQACSPAPYPPLPGEGHDRKADVAKKTGRFAKMLQQTTNRGSAMTNTIVRGSDAVDRSGLAADSRDKFVWTNFNFSSTQKPVLQAQK